MDTYLERVVLKLTKLSLTIKNCYKIFLKNILRLLKTTAFRRWLNVIIKSKKNICKLQSIYTKTTIGDKKLYY